MVKTVSGAEFDQEVKQAKGLVVVDFYAEWCGPCKAMAPVLDEFAKAYEGKIKFAKVDVDRDSALAQQFNIRSMPTLIVFKDGQEVVRGVGFPGKAALKEGFDTFLKKWPAGGNGSTPRP